MTSLSGLFSFSFFLVLASPCEAFTMYFPGKWNAAGGQTGFGLHTAPDLLLGKPLVRIVRAAAPRVTAPDTAWRRVCLRRFHLPSLWTQRFRRSEVTRALLTDGVPEKYTAHEGGNQRFWLTFRWATLNAQLEGTRKRSHQRRRALDVKRSQKWSQKRKKVAVPGIQ